jgi:hypothetical protein
VDLRISVKAADIIGNFMQSNAKLSPSAVFGPTFKAEDAEANIILTQLQAVTQKHKVCPGEFMFGRSRTQEFVGNVQSLWYNWQKIATDEIQANSRGSEVHCTAYRPNLTSLKEWGKEHRPLKISQTMSWQWTLRRLREAQALNKGSTTGDKMLAYEKWRKATQSSVKKQFKEAGIPNDHAVYTCSVRSKAPKQEGDALVSVAL